VNLRQIEVFRAVMMAGSISGAAELLRVSQPAVSQVLRHTEDHLRLSLFERVKGRLRPTPAARALYTEVCELYSGVERVRSLAESLLRSASGSLHVVASPSLGRTLLPMALARFRETCPAVRIGFETLGYKSIIAKLLSHKADLAVVVGHQAQPSLKARHLCRVKLVCALPNGHPLAVRDAVGPADLRPYPLISFNTESFIGRTIDAAFVAAGETRNVVIEVPFGETARSLVRNNVGVAVLDQLTVYGVAPADLTIRPFVPETAIDVVIVRPDEHPRCINAKMFSRILNDVADGLTSQAVSPQAQLSV
jgi:DNA-binding transcriptional LysR family regulator